MNISERVLSSCLIALGIFIILLSVSLSIVSAMTAGHKASALEKCMNTLVETKQYKAYSAYLFCNDR